MIGRRALLRAAAASLAAGTAGPAFGQTTGAPDALASAGLGAAADGYGEVAPGRVLVFPADHAAHPAYRIEWWYLTAVLDAASGERFGVQWTLFRQAMTPPGESAPGRAGWSNAQFWMAHAGATTAEKHYSAERFARGGVGQAGVVVSPAVPFDAWLDNWSMTAEPGFDPQTLAPLRVRAAAPEFSYDLRLQAEGPLILQGDQGFSVKSASGQASYYYSQPFYRAAGALRVGGQTHDVAGAAWLDREWSSQLLTEDQSGWDWLCLHLEEGAGTKLMTFRVRDAKGEDYVTGNWITPDGASVQLAPGAVTMTELERVDVAGRQVPVRWRVSVPSRGVSVETRPLNPQSWMNTSFAYWEGPIDFTGSHAGVGYLEMTGY